MQRSTRSVLKLYAIGALWFAALLASIAILLTLGSSVYAALDLTAEARTAVTMIVAIGVASVAAAATWLRLQTDRTATTRQTAPSSDGTADAALTSIR